MKAFLHVPVLLAVALAPHASAEEEAADLQSYSVGERRPLIEPEKIEIERPKFDTSFKLEPSKPSLGGIRIEKPRLEVLPPPSQGAPQQTPAQPVQTADAGSVASAGSPAGAAGGGESRPIRPLSMEPPDYPREALLSGAEGYVVVEFTIDTDGRTKDISVVESEPRDTFDRDARRAVARWRFEPALRDGRPVEQRIRHTIEFTLNGQ